MQNSEKKCYDNLLAVMMFRTKDVLKTIITIQEKESYSVISQNATSVTMINVYLFSIAVALVCKYITKGWKGVQEEYGDKEKSEDLQKVFAYLGAVEKAKHCTDELELIHLIEEHRLEKEQILTNHLKSKEVGTILLLL